MKFQPKAIQSSWITLLIILLSTQLGYSIEPSWVSGYPQILSGASSFDLKVKVDQTGTVYYAVFKTAQLGITATQIKSYALLGGLELTRGGSKPVNSGSEYTINETSLTDNTTYHIYVVAESGSLLMNESKVSYTIRFFPKRQQEFTSFKDNIIVGHLMYFPENYYKDNQEYPLLVFLHGLGERSASETPVLSSLTNTALPMVIKNGKEIPMIVASPQAKYYWDNTQQSIDAFIEHLRTTYRINPSQIFLTGISMGGSGVFDYVNAFPQKINSIVPVSTWPDGDINNFVNVRMWGFMGLSDPSTLSQFASSLNALGGEAKFTQYSGGHVPSVWNAVYTGEHGDDIYSWLLQQPVDANSAPFVSAGADLEVTLPLSQIELNGSASDSDGTIAAMQWTKISGPQVTLGNTNTTTLLLSNITPGIYNFEFSAVDNVNASTTDQVQLIVNETSDADKTYLINLTWSVNQEGSGLWNNFITTSGGTAGTTAALFDSNKNASAVRLSIVSGFQDGNNNHGVVPGLYPTDVMRYYLRASQTKKGTLQISGLDIKKVYNLSMLSSNTDLWYPSDTRFTIGANSATINAKGNADKLVKFTEIKPDANGTITIEVSPATTNSDNYGIMNALVIEEITANTPPIVSAGPEQSVTMPVTEVQLEGSVTDIDGTITEIQWTKLSGPDVTLSEQNTATPVVTNITPGIYTFELTAKDNDDAIATDQVQLIVSENSTADKTYLVNLTWSVNQEGSGLWNNFITTSGGTAGTTAALFDSNKNASAVRLSIVSGFQDGNNNHGVVPGLYPTDVMRYYLRASQTKKGTLQISGLDIKKVYNLSMLSSNTDLWYPSDTRFTIGANSATINAKGNADKLVKFTEIKPDANGTITIEVSPATTNSENYGIVNALVIEEQTANNPPIANAGPDLSISLPVTQIQLAGSVSDTDGTIIAVQWTKISGPAVTLTNTNTTTPTLSDISPGIYTFELSATDDGSAITTDSVQLTVNETAGVDKTWLVNLTWSVNQESSGIWNNFITSNGGTEGTSALLFDSDKNPSIVRLTIAAAFQDGTNNHGVAPGLYPTSVMRYYLRSTQTKKGALKISGLDVNKAYNFSLMSSNYDLWYPSDTEFTIGTNSATINAKNNSNNLVNFTGIIPNANGEIMITVAPATSNSENHGIINAIVITEVSNENIAGRKATKVAENNASHEREANEEQMIKFYPNPVEDHMFLEFNPSGLKADPTSLEFYDISGNLIHELSLGADNISAQRAQINTNFMKPGLYLMYLRTSGNQVHKFKVMKK